MKAINAILAATAACFLTAAAPAFAACDNCGTVTDVKTVTRKGEGSGVGLVAGGVIGGVLGHQVGSGRGNTAATVVGAGAGAYAGNEIEKNNKTKTTYQVVVRMENGSDRSFSYANPTAYKVGDAVKVVNKKLVRQ
ncbi:MAG: glycine zipper 2TM domain-containing protein [Usitatibacter sp.]